jgi:hypothetical protein
VQLRTQSTVWQDGTGSGSPVEDPLVSVAPLLSAIDVLVSSSGTAVLEDVDGFWSTPVEPPLPPVVPPPSGGDIPDPPQPITNASKQYFMGAPSGLPLSTPPPGMTSHAGVSEKRVLAHGSG